jgi:hypothetical protein
MSTLMEPDLARLLVDARVDDAARVRRARSARHAARAGGRRTWLRGVAIALHLATPPRTGDPSSIEPRREHAKRAA